MPESCIDAASRSEEQKRSCGYIGTEVPLELPGEAKPGRSLKNCMMFSVRSGHNVRQQRLKYEQTFED